MGVRPAHRSVAFWFMVCTTLYLIVFSMGIRTASVEYIASFWFVSTCLSFVTAVSCALHGPSKGQLAIKLSTVFWVVLCGVSITNAAKAVSLIP